MLLLTDRPPTAYHPVNTSDGSTGILKASIQQETLDGQLGFGHLVDLQVPVLSLARH